MQATRVLVVGVGGLGCPAALALAEAGVGTLGLVDDDTVEIPNLHRQILFCDEDRGKSKVVAAKRALERRASDVRIELHDTRLLPENALTLVGNYDLVVEGSDNYATKFLASDACARAGRPIVHGGAVGLRGTVLGVAASGRPCYRCLFEDLPSTAVTSCETAGVLGPLVGLVGALQAHVALSLLRGAPGGALFTVDGARLDVRERSIAPRPSCTLCGAAPSVPSIERSRYVRPCGTT